MFFRLSEISFGFLGILSCFILTSLLQITAVSFKHTWYNKTYVVKISKESHHFVDMIFRKFGSNDTGSIEVEQFKNLLQQLHIADNKETVKKAEKGNHRDTHTRSLDQSIDNKKVKNSNIEGPHVQKGQTPKVTKDDDKKRNSLKEHDNHIKVCVL